MFESRVLTVLSLGLCSLALVGCSALGNVTSEGLVDEYSIPQNRGLAYPTDFSRLPTPENPRDVIATLPSQSEIESLMFTLDPAPTEDYVPITVVTGDVPEYQPIGRIVGSGSNGAAQQALISTQTNAAGSLFPIDSPVMPLVPGVLPVSNIDVVTPAADPFAGLLAPASAERFEGVTLLSAEDAAALSALAIGAPVTTLQPLGLPAATQPIDAQPVTSLPDGVTIVGEPVVLQR